MCTLQKAIKIRVIGIASDGKEYTNDDTIKECDYPTILEYDEMPTEEQLCEDMGRALVMLQFDLPEGVTFIRCRHEILEN